MKFRPSLFYKLRRSIESPIVAMRFFRPVVNVWRLGYLRWLARIHGGHVVIGKNVKLDHPTLFQGRGKLVIGDNVWLGFDLAGALRSPILLQPREADSEIILGRNCAIMNGCEVVACKSIQIGENTQIGPHTLIYDSDFHNVDPEYRHLYAKSAPVILEENVWIGSKAIILKGVHIGKDSVVAAGCIVSKDVPAGVLVAGNPMRVIRSVYGVKKEAPDG